MTVQRTKVIEVNEITALINSQQERFIVKSIAVSPTRLLLTPPPPLPTSLFFQANGII